jgi:ketosteroid isomerase-like protein
MTRPLAIVALATLAACARPAPADGPADIRAAEARLVAHLQGPDPLAWVGDYTEDAVFQEGSDPPVSGRAALTEVAKGLGGLSQVEIVPLRTLVQGNLAYVQVRGRYAVGQGAAAQPAHWFRGVMIWRRDSDGVWRMLHEMLAPEPVEKAPA